jgi:hypothetical protein
VNAVCAFYKHRELFSSVQLGVNNELLYSFNTLELCQDGSVCWNSVYLKLLCCLEPKEHINRFIRRHSSHEASDNNLNYSSLTNAITEDAWDDIKALLNFLEAPYQMTKRLEGNNSSNGFGSLWQTLPNLQALWVHFEEARKQENSEFMANAVTLGFKKLNTYFITLIYEPDISYYTITTALNSALSLNWFLAQWKHYPQWVTKAQKLLKKVFDDYVKQNAASDNDKLREPPSSQRKLPASDLYSRATAVNTHLLTGSKNKCQ